MEKIRILQLIAACTIIFAAAGCAEEQPPHTHTFSPDWTANETYHWHAATCEHTSETAGLKEHKFVDGVCTVCGYEYVPPHVHVFEDVEFDEYRHWGYCVECQEEVNERHVWQDNVCTVCGYDAGGSKGLIWSEDGVLIGASAAREIEIPELYNGMPVTTIGEGAFKGLSTLEKVTLPSSLTTIGESAFEGCSALSEIQFPKSVAEIGANAFWGCSAFTSLTVPDTVKQIGEGAFGGCSSLEQITLPFIGQSVSSEIKYPFGYLFGTKSFEGGVSTMQYYSLPDGMMSISYVLPSALKTVSVKGNLPYGTFRNCKSIETVLLSDITEIGERAFDNCTGIESITLPTGIVKIGDYAFTGCTGLTEITLGGALESIGRNSFEGCTGLEKVTIGERVTSIGKSAFTGCTQLHTAVFEQSMGWFCTTAASAQTGEVVPEFDGGKAAEFLTDTYCDYYWKRI